jgi:hypothetical protein
MTKIEVDDTGMTILKQIILNAYSINVNSG